MKNLVIFLVLTLSINSYAAYTIITAKYGKEKLGAEEIQPYEKANLYLQIKDNDTLQVSSILLYKFLHFKPPFSIIKYSLMGDNFVNIDSDEPNVPSYSNSLSWNIENNNILNKEPVNIELSHGTINDLFTVIDTTQENDIPMTKNNLNSLKPFNLLENKTIQ